MALTLDYTHLMADAVGPANGLTDAELDSLVDRTRRIHADLQSRRGAEGDLGFYNLPDDRAGADEIKALAKRLRETNDTLVVLGIGGSALGVIALQTALRHTYHNLLPSERGKGVRLFVPDNPDPELTADLLEAIDPKKTVFNVITKSGSTSETMAHYLIVRDFLKRTVGADKVKDHLVITTDPAKGVLRKIAKAEGITTLPIPAAVGGRFSVLTSVGLFPAAMLGVDIDALLAGAGSMAKRCDTPDFWNNPAYIYGGAHYLLDTQKHKNMAVMMPYASALRDMADWFRQLWAESLGKRIDIDGKEVRVGQTPVNALGATDQHSQVQLYVEGPRDKVFTFLTVEKWRRDTPIPADHTDEDALKFLGKKTLGQLLSAEQVATEYALTSVQQANCKIVFPTVDEHHIGEFFMMTEIATALCGGLYHINAFDQPGVEAGKDATYALMEKPGFEEAKKNLERALSQEKRRTI